MSFWKFPLKLNLPFHAETDILSLHCPFPTVLRKKKNEDKAILTKTKCSRNSLTLKNVCNCSKIDSLLFIIWNWTNCLTTKVGKIIYIMYHLGIVNNQIIFILIYCNFSFTQTSGGTPWTIITCITYRAHE